jgi:hypothetical protein
MPHSWTPPPEIDQFRLERRLGRGATAEVWLARDTLLDRVVALKIARIPASAEVRDALSRRGARGREDAAPEPARDPPRRGGRRASVPRHRVPLPGRASTSSTGRSLRSGSSRSASTSRAASPPRTAPGSFTATSSPPTRSSPTTASPSCSTSAWRSSGRPRVPAISGVAEPSRHLRRAELGVARRARRH